ncbi:MAG: helix-turn-helix domain-containing protein [Arcanobacterium sp.]
MPELLSPSEVADIFKVSRQTITRWCNNGKLNHIILPSGQFRIPQSEVDRFLVPVIDSAPSAESASDTAPLF